MKKSITNKLITCILFFLFIFSSFVNAEEIGRAGYAGAALRMGLGARAMALGGGSPALCDDIYASYYNPAGLVFLEDRWVSFTLNQMSLDRKIFYAGYAQSIEAKEAKSGAKQPRAGFSVGWLAAGVDNIDGRDYNGSHYDTFSNWEHTFYFSFAIQPASFLSFGASAKILHNRFPKLTTDNKALTSTTLGFDLGAIIKLRSNLQVGLSVHDFNSKNSWDTQNVYAHGSQTNSDFPVIGLAGIAWKCFLQKATLLANYYKVDGMEGDLLLGAEIYLVKGFVVRTGLRDGELTAGGGYQFATLGKHTRVDYAFVTESVAPSPYHVFTWSFLF